MVYSDDEVDTVIINLKILSQIKENEKLSTSSCPIEIQNQKNHYLPFLRWFYGESREKTIAKLKQISYNAITILQYTIEQTENYDEAFTENKTSPSKTDQHVYKKHKNITKQLNEGITGAIGGLQKLQTTYGSDQTSVAQLAVLIERLQSSKLEG